MASPFLIQIWHPSSAVDFSEYEAFITLTTTRVEPISLDDLTEFLLSQEARLEETFASDDVLTANLATPSAGKNRGNGNISRH